MWQYAIENKLLQIEQEEELLRNEDEQLKKLVARFAEPDASLSAIMSSSYTISNLLPPTHDKSEL